MGPALARRAAEIEKLPTGQRRGYAAVADRHDIDAIHRSEGVKPGQRGICPHAQAATTAARKAEELARRAAPSAVPSFPSTNPTGNKFDYNHFYASELDKKHQDKSYR